MAFLLKDYTDIQEIGHGGMGKVYLATQISLNRKVIIKEMATGLLTNKTEIKRFENEARAAAALDHDNIIRIYDFGEDRGSFYIAMEYIDGPDLEAILKDKNYVPEIGLMIVLFALKGLVHAHSHRIIHRDIKPGNILVSKAGAVKVVDFGLAHASSQQMHLTASDVIVGTPLFMSPEQATGEEKKDLRMDVWSVGVLLYRMITGNYPFVGDNVPSILFHIVQTKEPPILELCAALPVDLASNIDKCLIKDRGRRLSNLFPLIESLQNYFFDMGIKDPAEEIRRYVSDPSSYSKVLSARILEYHQRKAEEYGAAGNTQRSEAHAQQAKRYDPLYKPIIKAIDVIKKHTSSSIIAKQTSIGTVSGVGTWQPPSRIRIGNLVFISALVLAVAVAGAALFYFQIWNKKEPRVIEQPVAMDQRIFVDSAAGGDSDFLASNIPGERTDDTTDILSSQETAVQKHAIPNRAGRKTAAAPEQKDTVSLDTAAAVSVPARLVKTRKPKQPRSSSSSDSQSGILKIAITPASAQVHIDGEKLAKQEMNEGRRLITGLHHLDASAEGYEPFSKSITVEKDAIQIVTIDLVPEKPGMSSVHIHSYPWAEIYVDNEFKGNSPTAKPIALTEGTHAIVLKRPGYKTYEEKIVLKKGELRRMKVQLTSEK